MPNIHNACQQMLKRCLTTNKIPLYKGTEAITVKSSNKKKLSFEENFFTLTKTKSH